MGAVDGSAQPYRHHPTLNRLVWTEASVRAFRIGEKTHGAQSIDGWSVEIPGLHILVDVTGGHRHRTGRQPGHRQDNQKSGQCLSTYCHFCSKDRCRVVITQKNSYPNSVILISAGAQSSREGERVRGIEPPLRAWEARVLPLNYTRVTSRFPL